MEMFRRGSRRDSRRDSKDVKNKWSSAISGVRKQSVRRASALAEIDPFLERFTVTGRALQEDEEEFTCRTLFTRKFWSELVLDPANISYYYWSLVVTIAVLYNLIFVILRSVYYHKLHVPELIPVWITLDYTADCIYMFDMFLKSRLGFLEQGLLVKDVKRLRKMYLKSWKFIVGVICLIPLDFLYLLIGFNCLLRLNRCIKVWRLSEFTRLAETHTNFPNLFRVINLILVIILIIHWNACIYFTVSRSLGFGVDSWVYPNPDDPTQPEYSDFWMQYIYSFYWSVLTLTTIGDTNYPVHVLSYVYCIIDSLVGVLIFATIFGNVGAMINEMDATRTEFQRKVDSVKRYMEIRQVGNELQERVVKWFDYTWNNKQSIDDRQALEFLPEKLRAEISIHVHLSTLRRVAIFQDCEPGLLVELVLKLRLQVFSPGDYICRKGDIGKEMYIVKRGKLQVVSEDGKKVFVTLQDGSVFGEVSILNIAGNRTGNRRTASVRSLGYSDLFCLSKNDLWDALQEYPEAKKLLSERGKQILRKDNLLDEEAARREERRQQNLDKKIELIADAIDDLQKDVCKLSDRVNKIRGLQLRKDTTSSLSVRNSITGGPSKASHITLKVKESKQGLKDDKSPKEKQSEAKDDKLAKEKQSDAKDDKLPKEKQSDAKDEKEGSEKQKEETKTDSKKDES